MKSSKVFEEVMTKVFKIDPTINLLINDPIKLKHDKKNAIQIYQKNKIVKTNDSKKILKADRKYTQHKKNKNKV